MGVLYRHPVLGLSWAGSGETGWCRPSPLNRAFPCGSVFLGRSEVTTNERPPQSLLPLPEPLRPSLPTPWPLTLREACVRCLSSGLPQPLYLPRHLSPYAVARTPPTRTGRVGRWVTRPAERPAQVHAATLVKREYNSHVNRAQLCLSLLLFCFYVCSVISAI